MNLSWVKPTLVIGGLALMYWAVKKIWDWMGKWFKPKKPSGGGGGGGGSGTLGNFCMNDKKCDKGQFCDNNYTCSLVCTNPKSKYHDNCSAIEKGYICNPSSQRCEQPCTPGSCSDSNSYCDTSSKACISFTPPAPGKGFVGVTCNKDSQCNSGYCDSKTHSCQVKPPPPVTKCSTLSGCSGNGVCVNGVCQQNKNWRWVKVSAGKAPPPTAATWGSNVGDKFITVPALAFVQQGAVNQLVGGRVVSWTNNSDFPIGTFLQQSSYGWSVSKVGKVDYYVLVSTVDGQSNKITNPAVIPNSDLTSNRVHFGGRTVCYNPQHASWFLSSTSNTCQKGTYQISLDPNSTGRYKWTIWTNPSNNPPPKGLVSWGDSSNYKAPAVVGRGVTGEIAYKTESGWKRGGFRPYNQKGWQGGMTYPDSVYVLTTSDGNPNRVPLQATLPSKSGLLPSFDGGPVLKFINGQTVCFTNSAPAISLATPGMGSGGCGGYTAGVMGVN